MKNSKKIDHNLLSSLKDVSNNELKGNWNNEYFNNQYPIVLDLGCGNGDYIIALSELYSDKNFIGIDNDRDLIFHGAKKVFEGEMFNAAFINADLKQLDDYFDNEEVDEIWITFPEFEDYGKDLISINFLKLFFKLLKPDSAIHFKTDNSDFFEIAYDAFAAEGYRPVEKISDIHNSNINDYLINLKTPKELICVNTNQPVHYFRFICDK